MAAICSWLWKTGQAYLLLNRPESVGDVVPTALVARVANHKVLEGLVDIAAWLAGAFGAVGRYALGGHVVLAENALKVRACECCHVEVLPGYMGRSDEEKENDGEASGEVVG